MFDKEFDDIIKGKLESYRETGEVTGWEALSDRIKLDNEMSSVEDDLKFDQKITESLQDFKIPFEVSHWAILAERLEIEHALRMRILVIKSFELLILALIIFTFWNLQRFGLHQDNNITKVENSLFAENQNIQSNKEDIAFSDAVLLNNKKQIVKSNTSSSELTVLVNETNHRNDLPTIVDVNSVSYAKPVLDAQELNKIYSSSTALTFASVQDIEKKSAVENENIIRQEQSITSLDQIESSLDYRRILPSFKGSIIPIHRQNQVSNWWIKGFVQGDQNFVYSSYDEFYQIAGYETVALGLSGGLLVSKEFANTEIETGLIYSTKSYVPEIINETYRKSSGFYKISLRQIFFNVLSLPINLNIKVLDREKFGFYTSIGASANVVINSNFLIEEKSIPAATSPAFTETNSVLDDKPFERGFFEGGGLKNNSYLTMNFGLGAKYNLTDRIGLFSRIGYNYNIFNFGVGPNEDKINNLSIGFGSRLRI